MSSTSVRNWRGEPGYFLKSFMTLTTNFVKTKKQTVWTAFDFAMELAWKLCYIIQNNIEYNGGFSSRTFLRSFYYYTKLVNKD